MQTTRPAEPPPAQSPSPSSSSHGVSPDKRAYLALLPPSQIIDICLAFEPYAPSHVKTSVWPVDFTAAIAALQTQQPVRDASKTNERPAMASLQDATQSPPKPPSRSPRVKTPIVEPESSPPKPASGTPSANAPSQSHAFPAYPYHPAYPHAPYYASHRVPPGHSQYSSFPLTPHLHPNPTTNAPNPPPPDDLPSYEEMIVQALKTFSDPDGAAPKDLFSWMASHYPLQTNFRPSASQALQKAFKRGRFLKSTNGRYRLNPSWEGGNVSAFLPEPKSIISPHVYSPRHQDGPLDVHRHNPKRSSPLPRRPPPHPPSHTHPSTALLSSAAHPHPVSHPTRTSHSHTPHHQAIHPATTPRRTHSPPRPTGRPTRTSRRAARRGRPRRAF